MRKLIVVADNVAMYMRFSTEEQAKEFDKKYLILNKSEAKEMFNQLREIFKEETKIPNLLMRGVNNNGIF